MGLKWERTAVRVHAGIHLITLIAGIQLAMLIAALVAIYDTPILVDMSRLTGRTIDGHTYTAAAPTLTAITTSITVAGILLGGLRRHPR